MSCPSYNCAQPTSNNCPDQYGCDGTCPDFVIRRHDTKPSFRVRIEDCDGPMDLTDLILEATMWAKGKLKAAITDEDDYFAFADNIGFNQVMVGDIIIMDRARLPEKMLVLGFDETNRLLLVQRGYHGTPIQSWKKGSPIKIIKFMGATSETEMVYQDVLEMDGTTTTDVLSDSFFIYEWGPTDTCLPGCYYMEFKLMKMTETEEVEMQAVADIVPSFTSPDADFNCGLASGVDWVRRFPVDSEGFLIQITDSFTSEN